MFIYENDRIISRHLYSIRNTCSPCSLCIFCFKGLVFIYVMAQYLLEQLAITTISQLTFNMWLSVLSTTYTVFPWTFSLFNPASPLCPILESPRFKNTARRGRCWLTFEKTAHCLISALVKSYVEIIFIQSKQSEWKNCLKFVKNCPFVSLATPETSIKLGNEFFFTHLQSP